MDISILIVFLLMLTTKAKVRSFESILFLESGESYVFLNKKTILSPSQNFKQFPKCHSDILKHIYNICQEFLQNM